ncbi:hypothetical protein QE197_14380 [Arsenophonus nasoniae]|uniref:Uncharacterized protein n=1 Tax=Arsenophonus nasoniae TaxID=638 RepID=D2U1H0_9GAMM|nr:hypothetical protein [Arsenophonus nasoniae]QBY44692.1 hypothetical protein ArsFIN_32780 [Arsenophonus nasoniae]WGM04923.1 hypothetical protein QE258_15230 [Arsenophonus nasoniae]WGM10020.1 hypothetical protein QE197_14380 [Arsenophonus nasoniae]WGM14735.1 hypothetical protein QE193_14295 [Arsenophonus nasoniae]CBA74598.1 hypothetical protein ARN_23960 [Arsenophonus nasoniae]
MKSLCKVVVITVFLTFSYSAGAANNNINIDTNKKPTNKYFKPFNEPSKCIPVNSIIDGLPAAE